jgi:hypothetical protein
MRLSLTTALLATVLAAPSLGAQALDQTMVPRGRLRLQASPISWSWDTRFGRAVDGSESTERLGDDLTDPTGLSLFPGIPTLTQMVREITGDAAYDPVLGPTDGRITQEMNRIEFGGDIGVFDWLTIGAVVPWVRNRTAVDLIFRPDTINGNLGLNPTITDPGGVDAFLGSTVSADAAAQSNATSMCAGGASAASPFFPLVGTTGGTALEQIVTTLSTDLTAAGLPGLSALTLANETLTADGLALLPTLPGAGIDALLPLQTRRGLWAVGDVEVSARIRLLDNLTPSAGEPEPGFGYRVTGSFLARLATGTQEDPDVLLDIGTGDQQMDLQGGLAAQVRFGGQIGLAVSGYYASQGSTTLLKRVASPELVMPSAATRREVRWQPGTFVGFDASPALHLSSTLTLAGEYRFFQKRRDSFELVRPDPALDPVVLELESGVTIHQVGGGLRYDTVEPWLRGEASRPLELHLRLLHSLKGGGGQTPNSTRIEAGIRLFRRFWGPN